MRARTSIALAALSVAALAAGGVAIALYIAQESDESSVGSATVTTTTTVTMIETHTRTVAGGDDSQTTGEETTTGAAAGSCRGNPGKKVPVTRGLVVPNRGAFGVTLGMSRREVIDCLGPPLAVSNYGAMSYSRRQILDIYFKDERVALLNLGAPGFCLPHRICEGDPNALRKLHRHYKGTCDSKTFDGEEVIVLPGRLNGRKVQTTFYPSSDTFLQLHIAFVSESLSLPCEE